MADQEGAAAANDGGQKQERTNQAKIDKVQKKTVKLKNRNAETRTNIPLPENYEDGWGTKATNFTKMRSPNFLHSLIRPNSRVSMPQNPNDFVLLQKLQDRRNEEEEKEKKAEQEKQKEKEEKEKKKKAKMTKKQKAKEEEAEKKKAKNERAKKEKDEKLSSPNFLSLFIANITSNPSHFLFGLFASQSPANPASSQFHTSGSMNSLTPGPSGFSSTSNQLLANPSLPQSYPSGSTSNQSVAYPTTPQFYPPGSTSNQSVAYPITPQVYSSNPAPRPNDYPTRPTADLIPGTSYFSGQYPPISRSQTYPELPSTDSLQSNSQLRKECMRIIKNQRQPPFPSPINSASEKSSSSSSSNEELDNKNYPQMPSTSQAMPSTNQSKSKRGRPPAAKRPKK